MDYALALFYAFAAVAVASAVGVIGARNPVHAALWLVLTFFSVACTWLLIGAEFLGVALVLVYVGAVMVLFLFVVMMLDVNFDNLRSNFKSYIPVGATVGLLVLLEMTLVLLGGGVGKTTSLAVAQPSNTRALGKLLYVDYVYPFELAAVILLVAIVAAIALTWRRRKETRYQNPSEQVKVRREDRVRLVSMASEKPDTDG